MFNLSKTCIEKVANVDVCATIGYTKWSVLLLGIIQYLMCTVINFFYIHIIYMISQTE